MVRIDECARDRLRVVKVRVPPRAQARGLLCRATNQLFPCSNRLPRCAKRRRPPSLVSAMEPFLRELDDNAEVLPGIEDKDVAKWQPVIEHCQRNFSRATETGWPLTDVL